MTTPKGPLSGLLVLDFGQVYNGPYCGVLLGFLGARVIKIESPEGDIVRRRHKDREPYPYLWLNSNKESLALDLKTSQGQEIVRALAAKADVVVENFRSGVMDRCGVGWSVLHKINPRLIYGSGSGFGLDGPNKEIPAMDLTIQAISGAISVTGFEDGPPVKAGPAISDFLGGIHLCAGILAALYEREKSGKGQLVESSMQEAMVFSLVSAMGAHLEAAGGGKKVPPRTGNRHPGHQMAPYNVYPTSDGYVAIICVSEKHWHDLTVVIGREDMFKDSRLQSTIDRANNMDEVDAAVSAWTRLHTKQEIKAKLTEVGVPFAPVQTVAEVAEDSNLMARGMWQDMPHEKRGTIRLPCSPLKFHGTPSRGVERIAPSIGQDTKRILREVLEMDDEMIESLLTQRVVSAKAGSQ